MLELGGLGSSGMSGKEAGRRGLEIRESYDACEHI